MAGQLHIFRLDAGQKRAAQTEPQFQANYSTPGNNYAGEFTQERLKDMLRFGLGMKDEEVLRIMAELYQSGRFTLSNVEIPIPETGMFGLEQTPGDF
jgi:hypothetical protein